MILTVKYGPFPAHSFQSGNYLLFPTRQSVLLLIWTRRPTQCLQSCSPYFPLLFSLLQGFIWGRFSHGDGKELQAVSHPNPHSLAIPGQRECLFCCVPEEDSWRALPTMSEGIFQSVTEVRKSGVVSPLSPGPMFVQLSEQGVEGR